MREIEFRGKCIRDKNREYRSNYRNGDWVYGLVTEIDNYYKRSVMTNFDGISGIDIQTETIGQYTGLVDKNGTKIFEGDIVKKEYFDKPYSSKRKSKELIGVVKWKEFKASKGVYEACFDVEITDKNYETYRCWNWSRFYECEIIGNIYDNPELLEATDD